MIRALSTAAAGMNAQQLTVDVIANNLANVNTSGFKRSRVDFQDLLYQTERVPGTATARNATVPVGIQVGMGSRPGAVYKLFSQGTFQQTGNSLDVAVEGDGFLQVLLPDGRTAYTRDGSFKVDSAGQVVTSDGFPLQPELNVPTEALSVSIGESGVVSVTLPGQEEPQEIGQLQLSRFVNPAGLQSVGRNLFVPTFASGAAQTGTPGLDGYGTLAQGFLETSNVKVVEEMVALITALRAYEVNSKAIQTADDMLAIANQVRQ